MTRMIRCTVVAPMGVTVGGGLVGLTAAQAAAREHVATPVEGQKGVYALTGPTMFKHGEAVGFPEGDVPKSSASGFEVHAPRKRKDGEPSEE